MDKLVKLAVVIGVLLAGIGVFYHYVIFLPSVEREKVVSAERVEREKVVSAERERNSVETRENQRRMIYESCILNARQNYDANWSAACRSDAERNAKSLRDCLNDRQILNNQFMGADYCKKTYGEVDASPSCSLPNSQSNSINAFHKQAQEKCVTEARLGLQ